MFDCRRAIGAFWIVASSLAGSVTPARAADWVVGANIGNVPWEFQDAQGRFVGFEIDLVNEVARRTGHRATVENIPFNGLFAAVASGRIQIAISSITVTPLRLQTLAFSQPYYDSDQSLSVLRASRINALPDLAGKTVGVDTASTGDIWATANTAKYRIAGISRYEGLAPAMLDLAAGRIDGYLSDLPAVAYYIKDKPQYRVAARVATGERYAFMASKRFADLGVVNDALSAMKKDGFVAATHQKWFGAPAPAGSSTAMVRDMPR